MGGQSTRVCVWEGACACVRVGVWVGGACVHVKRGGGARDGGGAHGLPPPPLPPNLPPAPPPLPACPPPPQDMGAPVDAAHISNTNPCAPAGGEGGGEEGEEERLELQVRSVCGGGWVGVCRSGGWERVGQGCKRTAPAVACLPACHLPLEAHPAHPPTLCRCVLARLLACRPP